MKWHTWTHCMKLYKNRIIGIKENKLAFSYNSRLSLKKNQLLYSEPTPVFPPDIIIVTTATTPSAKQSGGTVETFKGA